MTTTKRVRSLAAVAARGDRRKTLAALRDRLAASIDECEQPHQRASLARQLRETERDLAALASSSSNEEMLRNRIALLERQLAERAAPNVSQLDRMRERNAAGSAGAEPVASAGGRGGPRRRGSGNRVG